MEAAKNELLEGCDLIHWDLWLEGYKCVCVCTLPLAKQQLVDSAWNPSGYHVLRPRSSSPWRMSGSCDLNLPEREAKPQPPAFPREQEQEMGTNSFGRTGCSTLPSRVSSSRCQLRGSAQRRQSRETGAGPPSGHSLEKARLRSAEHPFIQRTKQARTTEPLFIALGRTGVGGGSGAKGRRARRC